VKLRATQEDSRRQKKRIQAPYETLKKKQALDYGDSIATSRKKLPEGRDLFRSQIMSFS